MIRASADPRADVSRTVTYFTLTLATSDVIRAEQCPEGSPRVVGLTPGHPALPTSSGALAVANHSAVARRDTIRREPLAVRRVQGRED